MKSLFFKEEHEIFRQSLRSFFNKEVAPNINQWETDTRIPSSIWKAMGDQGFLGINFPEAYGGFNADFFYSVVFLEELARIGSGGFSAAVAVHQYVSTAHLAKVGSEVLKQKYLVPAIEGSKVGALAISEPHAGSDVGGVLSTAVRDGDHYVINGSKTFITNGVYADFVTIAVKTNTEAGINGISLIVVDGDTPGFSRTKLKKMGWHCSDTGELAFDDVRVPVENLIGEEGKGFFYIMESFQLERLVMAIGGIGGLELCMELTLQYMKERTAFGRPIAKFQALRHRLADLATEIEAAKQFTYHTCWLHAEGEFAVKECSMAKLLVTELGKKVADECLQFFGGYGYMEEYPIARIYRDARVGTIAGGTSEIMREIIAKMIVDQVNYDSSYNKKNGDQAKPQLNARQIIESIPNRFKKEKAADYSSTFHFDLRGEEGGQFTVKIDQGNCQLEEGLKGEAACVLTAEAKTYAAVELGLKSPEMAIMNGDIQISDLGAMMQFTKLFKRIKA